MVLKVTKSRIMAKTISVRVLASGMYGIQSITVKVEYNGNATELNKAVIAKVFAMGYPSILHYTSINDIEDGKMVFNPEVLAKNGLADSIIDSCIEAGKYRDIVAGRLISEGLTRESAHKMYVNHMVRLKGIRDTLMYMGVDVQDAEGQRVINANMGV